MDKSDLETYQVQLDQVELALQSDPDNAELASLRSELKELIALTQEHLAAAAASASTAKSKSIVTPTSTHTWSAGNECLAKYSGDGQWYPARIISIGGSTENRMYSIMFKGYNTTELVNGSTLKPLPANHSGVGPSSGGVKRKLTKVEEEEREKKKKKNEKKAEVRAQKAKEQNEKQATWQKFAKKSEKKGIHIAGVAGTSIFKTPENPLGKGAFLVLGSPTCR
jgi:survival of motor neuron-related-splicing factor 30